MAGIAPPVVVVDRGRETGVVITVDMNSRLQRQAHADKPGLRRVAETEPRYGEDLVRQCEDLANGFNVIAQHADRTAAEVERLGRENTGLQGERGVDGGVEEPFEGTVRLRVAAEVAELFEAARIAEKDEKHRRRGDPRPVWNQGAESIAASAVLHPDGRGLLKIRFRGGRERRGEQQAHERFGDRAVAVAALRPAHQHLSYPGILRDLAPGIQPEIDIESEAGA